MVVQSPQPKRFNSEACDIKHKMINKRLEKHDDEIGDLSEAVIRLVAIQENQEKRELNESHEKKEPSRLVGFKNRHNSSVITFRGCHWDQLNAVYLKGEDYERIYHV